MKNHSVNIAKPPRSLRTSESPNLVQTHLRHNCTCTSSRAVAVCICCELFSCPPSWHSTPHFPRSDVQVLVVMRAACCEKEHSGRPRREQDRNRSGTRARQETTIARESPMCRVLVQNHRSCKRPLESFRGRGRSRSVPSPDSPPS